MTIDEKATAYLQLRIKPSQKKIIEDRAAKLGLKMAEYVIMMCCGKKRGKK